MEPARAKVKNRKRAHAKTQCCMELKEGDMRCMASKMAGVMGMARWGTC